MQKNRKGDSAKEIQLFEINQKSKHLLIGHNYFSRHICQGYPCEESSGLLSEFKFGKNTNC